MVLFIGTLGVCLLEQIIIIATSFCGSYAAVFSLGLIFGKFPNLYTLAK